MVFLYCLYRCLNTGYFVCAYWLASVNARCPLKGHSLNLTLRMSLLGGSRTLKNHCGQWEHALKENSEPMAHFTSLWSLVLHVSNFVLPFTPEAICCLTTGPKQSGHQGLESPKNPELECLHFLCKYAYRNHLNTPLESFVMFLLHSWHSFSVAYLTNSILSFRWKNLKF